MPIGNGGIIGPANVPTLASAKGVWSLREAQLAQRQGIWPLGLIPDPYFEYTTLLLPGNGTNGEQNNTFLDSGTANSGSGFLITRNGNTTQGTFSPFSQTGWGNYFNATGDYLSVADSAALRIGTQDFWIEAWVFVTSYSAVNHIINKRVYNNIGTGTWYFNITTGGAVVFNEAQTGTAIITTNSNAVPLNNWTHVAVSRDSSDVWRIFINGNSSGTTSPTNNFDFSTTQSIIIGWINDSTNLSFKGYISNLRFGIGSANYTSNFLPSTTPLTNNANTVLLTCQSNRFKDNSTNNFTVTATGSPSVQAFSPFNPVVPWTAANNGGSGYFDGTGDYLSVANNAAFNVSSNAFCVEAWFYPTASTSSIITWSVAFTGIEINLSSGSVTLELGSGSSWFITGANCGTAVLNAWNHVAIVKNSNGNIGGFLNGVRNYSTTNTTAIGNSNTFVSVGSNRGSSNYFTGYISSLRYVNGSSVYDPTQSTLTVPTAPLTAITNTSLLLNFTNAGIYDATSKNDLETLDNTVNGVRISTDQYKFYGSSIYFDGTGTDYLWIQANQPIQRFGTGNFTIELWIRLAATGSARGLVAKGTSTTGWLVSLNSSNQVVFTYGTSTITSSGTVSAGVWTYLAVVREGTGANQTKIYINASNDGTGTVSTDFTQTNSMYIGANRTGGDLFSGYMQDVRITNYARTITLPTSPFAIL